MHCKDRRWRWRLIWDLRNNPAAARGSTAPLARPESQGHLTRALGRKSQLRTPGFSLKINKTSEMMHGGSLNLDLDATQACIFFNVT